MNANERRKEIIRILRGTIKIITTPQLAMWLKASKSTIKRDILILTVDEGYPIDTVQGNGGGIILRDTKHPHKNILSQEQSRILEEFAQNCKDPYKASILIGIRDAYGRK
ncbi:MAG: HTH domain-containing protein [Lachnospiraceae bacterium]|nr:HTH domain-containing protein [Lachnospiraceae bacterium]